MAKPKSYHVLVYPEHGLSAIPVEQIKSVFKRIARSANLSRGVYILRVTGAIQTERGEDYQLASFEKQPTIEAINRYRFKIRPDSSRLEVYVGTISVPLDAVLEGICTKINLTAMSVVNVSKTKQIYSPKTQPEVATPQPDIFFENSAIQKVVGAEEVPVEVSPSCYATDRIMNEIALYHEAILKQIHHYQSLLLLPHNSIMEGYKNIKRDFRECRRLLRDIPRLQQMRLKQLRGRR